MDGRKIVVVEANEVPRRVVEDAARAGQAPFFDRLLRSEQLIDTKILEELPRELYPSQSWASMNTGVPWSDHGVFWYGDPKPAAYPLYWQVAAQHRSVGLVNTLHSSPVDEQCAEGRYRFAIPDCFSTDNQTIPEDFAEFQRLNRDLTKANGRKTSLKIEPAQLKALLKSVPKLGVRGRTSTEIIRLIGGVVAGRVPRERLRAGQFLLLRDLFLRLLDRNDPDLAVFFTNHVAASMHRYWYAAYPGDFDEAHYDQEWVERYRHEIPTAVASLDSFLGDVERWCEAHDRTLVVVSSMGQGPSQRLESEITRAAVIADSRKFLDTLGIDPDVEVLGSMVPQLTLSCGRPELAEATAEKLGNAEAGLALWDVDRADNVVTLTYEIEVVEGDSVRLNGAVVDAAEVGLDVHDVDDHSSGRHIPNGLLGVANSPTFKSPSDDVVDYLEYAPALLQHLGVTPAGHHRMPSFQI